MQKFEIIKTNHKDYYKIKNHVDELISQGYIIESINPVVTNSYKNNAGAFSSSEVEMLVYLLYRKEVENDDSKENNSM